VFCIVHTLVSSRNKSSEYFCKCDYSKSEVRRSFDSEFQAIGLQRRPAG